MKHSITSFETEIVQQILISELCFETCRSIPDIPGLGNHFLPYFHNLSYQRGVDSLYSLLLSRNPNELSLKHYIKLHKQERSNKDITALEKNIEQITKDFEIATPFSIRNKVGSHLDGDFTHTGFTSGYLMPETIDNLIKITQQLKKSFFPFVNHSLRDNPHGKLLEQIYKVVDEFTIEYAKALGKSGGDLDSKRK